MTTPQGGGWAIGGGGNSFPFERPGDFVGGTVFEYEPNLPQTHISGPLQGQPRTFSSGQAMVMHRVGLKVTKSSDPAKVGTEASIYLKGSVKATTPEGHGSTQAAVLGAIKAATGANLLQPGAELVLQYVADEPVESRSTQAAKRYAAWYTPPAFPVGAPDPTAQLAAPSAGASPVTPPAAVPAPATVTTPPAAPPAVATPAPAPSPAAPATPTAAPVAPGLTPEQTAQLAALQAAQAAPATESWDSDPRVAGLRANGVDDAMIRQVLGI